MSALLLVAAGVANGLLAGVFLAFTVAIGPGLRRVEDQEYVRVFRAINAAILNPVFLTVFVAAPVAACGAVLAGVVTGDHAGLLWPVLGAAGSVASFAITTVVNVPLNNRLAGDASATAETMTAARRAFESRWNMWNTVRALASAAALVCFQL